MGSKGNGEFPLLDNDLILHDFVHERQQNLADIRNHERRIQDENVIELFQKVFPIDFALFREQRNKIFVSLDARHCEPFKVDVDHIVAACLKNLIINAKNVINELHINRRIHDGFEHTVIKMYLIMVIDSNNRAEYGIQINVLNDGLCAIKFLLVFEQKVFGIGGIVFGLH